MINIKVGSPDQNDENNSLTVSLKIRKTSDGKLIIYDHKNIDIVISPNDHKLITFAKNKMGDGVYATQNSLMKFLVKKGVIIPESIRGGNIYSAIEAKYPEEGIDGINPFQALLFGIYKWLVEEKPKNEFEEEFEEEFEKYLYEPDKENSTELGEIPQKSKQGTIGKNDFYFPRFIYENINK